MEVVTVTLTAAGADLAARLPYRHRHGALITTVAEEWDRADALVLVCATGIAVRAIAPHLADKRSDPAVVVVDESGRHAVALTGGHAGGANDLAIDVADLLGAEPVVTTATDTRGLPALDQLPGLVASGDIAGVTRAWLDGVPPQITDELGWPLPAALTTTSSDALATTANDTQTTTTNDTQPTTANDTQPTTANDTLTTTANDTLATTSSDDGGRLLVTDRAVPPQPRQVVLHPPALVVGVGASTGAPATAAAELLGPALGAAGLDPAAVGLVATIDRRAADPVVTGLDRPVRAFSAGELAGVAVPHPSDVVAAEVGTPSVAEAAALLAAGPGAELVVPKVKGATATLAVARRRRPPGRVTVVGLGPGGAEHRTPAATAAVGRAEVVIGYSVYVEQCRHLASPAAEIVDSPIGAEVDRCDDALRRAAAGAEVTLVCSGDPGVFAMATLVLERAPAFGSPEVRVLPGVTAGLAAAAALGAPLAHDHALISLSDLLTPWPVIERRLRAVAAADLVVALYNPRSRARTEQFDRAVAILGEHRPPWTPVGVVTQVTRPDEHVARTTLGELDPASVGMFSLVIVGSTATRTIDGQLVTPRGYVP